MNKRIKELAQQADEGYTGDSKDDMGAALVGNDAIEKFAELIVRECSLFVFKQNGPKSALNLLEHFGVEE